MSFTKKPVPYTSTICHAAVVTLPCDCVVVTQCVKNQLMNTCTQNVSYFQSLDRILFNQAKSYYIVWLFMVKEYKEKWGKKLT